MNAKTLAELTRLVERARKIAEDAGYYPELMQGLDQAAEALEELSDDQEWTPKEDGDAA